MSDEDICLDCGEARRLHTAHGEHRGRFDTRSDGHSWFKRWWDAYQQAAFRADITGYRYRVWYDPANRWWNITELALERHRLT